MSTIVCKFGGSSLSDAGMFRRVANIVCSDGRRKFIVLSAPGKRQIDDQKITDLLYCAHRADSASSASIFSRIVRRYADICDALCPDFDLQGETQQIWQKLALSADYAASRGEYLCAKLFSAYSGMEFVDSAELIRFHMDGSLDAEATFAQVRSRLSGLEHAVIPGFYGCLPNGEIKTFSRGGSDVSGAIIASAVGADVYENWTDVDGLYTADPRLVKNAHLNPQVSLAQMEAIARAGAKLLHPDSLSILRGSGVDIHIRNSFHADAAGTRISENCKSKVRCITGRHNCGLTSAGNISEISVFGMDCAEMRRIHSLLKHVCIIHMQDHYKIITQSTMYETAIRQIHALWDCIS